MMSSARTLVTAALLAVAFVAACSPPSSPPQNAATAQPAADFVFQLRPILSSYSDWKRDFLRLLTVVSSMDRQSALARLDEIVAKARANEQALQTLTPPSDADAQRTQAQWLAAARTNQQVLALFREAIASGKGSGVDEARLQSLVAQATVAEEQADAALTALKTRYKLAP
ncbi:MAG: hypothetical protein EXR47_04860 [Dehalococcoidia bacterium]|nr:hypothetical protein [Dehalococcoidia bacterium]